MGWIEEKPHPNLLWNWVNPVWKSLLRNPPETPKLQQVRFIRLLEAILQGVTAALGPAPQNPVPEVGMIQIGVPRIAQRFSSSLAAAPSCSQTPDSVILVNCFQ